MIDITAYKVWEGLPVGTAANPVSFQLLQNGEAFGSPVLVTTEKTWTVPKYVDYDNPYVYTVEEINVPVGFEASYSEDRLTVTNTYINEEEPTWKGGTVTAIKEIYSDEPVQVAYSVFAMSTTDLSGFEFNLYKNIGGDDWVFVKSKSTDSNGIAEFTGLEAGIYKVVEGVRTGYKFLYCEPSEVFIEEEASSDTIYVVNEVTETPPEEEELIPPVKDDETPERPRRPRRPRPERPDVPETPDVPEIEDVVEEPVPEAPVLPPVIEEVVEVPEEPVPQATLPKTGAVNPAVASGLGALIIGLGLVLRKKED
jgi:serine-aspartate repeat-containing protein C/D/E